MNRVHVVLSLLLLAGTGPLAAQSLLPVPVSVEVRAGVGIPTGEFSEDDPGVGAEGGPAFGALLAVHVTSRLALVGGYSQARFDCPRCAQRGLEGTVVDQGGDFALQVTPARIGGLAPWIRAGGLLHQLTFTGTDGELSSDPALGLQVGGGVGLALPGALRLTPGVHYRTYAAELDLGELGNESVRVSHVLLDVGLSYRF
ncbi:MAG TPA: hypothetical protein VGR37_24630 [Longimicrobiaceae bacterium]|nr:hypothetical protein [Longimicrobiaceae bacterium]